MVTVKAPIALLFVVQVHFAFAQPLQSFNPIAAHGFNHDVIVESRQLGAVATTTTELDAISPSNFVLFSKAYAKAMSMEPGYGLPDNGKLKSKGKTFQLSRYNEPNALYLLKGSQGTLSFAPVKIDIISVLGLATEGSATFSITLSFTDGTSFVTTRTYPDWFDGPSPVIKGIGRVKRENVLNPYHEGGTENPRLYEVSVEIPQDKILRSVSFKNISDGDNMASNRAAIFALSGYKRPDPPVVTQEPVGETRETVVVKPEPAVVKQEPVIEKKDEPVVVKKEEREEIAPVTRPVIEVGAHTVLRKVLFKQSTAILLDQSYPQLDSISDFLLNNPAIHIEVAGHTDSWGSSRSLLKLSKERAAEIKKYLVARGISDDRVTSRGYGRSKPIAPNDTEESRSLNRRVEFVIISK
jgi:outer membrane protein OmpA-like peptidoglycan-associated protein